ncbi:MAG: S8 family serine peptidase [Polyangiaceae bacterium]|nr:S8 family serine peptidase [Polyangiaceae bacterium]
MSFWYGLNGTGVTIANLEGGSPDSWANLVPTGSCTTNKCACVNGKTGPHSRTTQGVMRNAVTTWRGSASDATVLAANFDEAVGCSFTAAVNWAVGKGANVFSRSGRCDCVSDWPHLPTCTNPGRLLDYVATVSPYPLVACASGNALPVSQGGDGEGSDEDSKAAVYNGIGVTGAEPDTASRAALTRYVPGQTQNRVGGANGWELPGIAAPARNLDTAGMNPGQVDQVSATSAATPVVAGIAASMMELNPAVKVRPEVLIPGLMVSADENVDDDLGGVWPMNLHDGRDDHDGAGVVNAVGAYWVLRPAAKMNGGNTAVPYGHDFGGVTSAGLPQGQWYGEIWNASVPAGATLRVGLMLMAKATCGSPATQTNCNPQTHPFAWLAFTRNGSSVSGSANAYNNIQFAGYKNTSGATETIQIKFMVLDWNGITSPTYWGIAWTAQGTGN